MGDLMSAGDRDTPAETIYEKHMRQLANHIKDETCWCNPTWEMFPECDGTENGPYLTHHLSHATDEFQDSED